MSATDPVALRHTRLMMKLQAEFPSKPFGVAVFAAGLMADWLNNLKVQPVGPVFLCSYYEGPDDWDVWVSTYHPRERKRQTRHQWC